MLSEVSHVAGDWAKDRAAELVGMRRVEDGTLTETPMPSIRFQKPRGTICARS
jgi:hypothetical protein